VLCEQVTETVTVSVYLNQEAWKSGVDGLAFLTLPPSAITGLADSRVRVTTNQLESRVLLSEGVCSSPAMYRETVIFIAQRVAIISRSHDCICITFPRNRLAFQSINRERISHGAASSPQPRLSCFCASPESASAESPCLSLPCY
jgi:hypothetical protein